MLSCGSQKGAGELGIIDETRDFTEQLWACKTARVLANRKRLNTVILAEAVSSLTDAIRLAPNDAEAQCNLGITLGKLGRLDEAIEHLQKAIKLNPDSAEAHCNLGAALGVKGQISAALKHLQEALRLKPGYADAQDNLRAALDARAASTSRSGAPVRP